MLSEKEKALLTLFRELGSMSQAQALEYHALLVKEAEEVPVFVAEAAPKKRGRPKK